MIIPTLRHQADGRAIGVEDHRQTRIILRRTPCPFRHTKGGQASVVQGGGFGKKSGIGRVRPWITAFNIVQPQVVQQRGNGMFILNRKIHICRLLSITQGGVKEIKFCHVIALLRLSLIALSHAPAR